jgi:MFS family permease
MNGFYYYILFSIIMELVLISIISYKKKNKIFPMQGMVISMSFAMNIGLTIGVLVGSLHQGNLFLSTIISMFAGLLVGLLCGIGLGLLPTIEGIMSGIMGGMMGAMLGEMIPESQSSIMLIILLTFSLCSLFLFLILPNKDKQDNKIYNWSWFLKPLLVLVILSSYLLFGFHLSKADVWNGQKDNELPGHHS